MKTPSNIFELNIYHHYQYQIKGWPNKTINKTYWERLFTLTDMLLYLTPRHVTGTSSKSTFLSTYKSTRAAAVTLPYSGALDFQLDFLFSFLEPLQNPRHKRHNAWDIARLLRLKHLVTNLSESKISRKFRAIRRLICITIRHDSLHWEYSSWTLVRD